MKYIILKNESNCGVMTNSVNRSYYKSQKEINNNLYSLTTNGNIIRWNKINGIIDWVHTDESNPIFNICIYNTYYIKAIFKDTVKYYDGFKWINKEDLDSGYMQTKKYPSTKGHNNYE